MNNFYFNPNVNNFQEFENSNFDAKIAFMDHNKGLIFPNPNENEKNITSFATKNDDNVVYSMQTESWTPEYNHVNFNPNNSQGILPIDVYTDSNFQNNLQSNSEFNAYKENSNMRQTYVPILDTTNQFGFFNSEITNLPTTKEPAQSNDDILPDFLLDELLLDENDNQLNNQHLIYPNTTPYEVVCDQSGHFNQIPPEQNLIHIIWDQQDLQTNLTSPTQVDSYVRGRPGRPPKNINNANKFTGDEKTVFFGKSKVIKFNEYGQVTEEYRLKRYKNNQYLKQNRLKQKESMAKIDNDLRDYKLRIESTQDELKQMANFANRLANNLKYKYPNQIDAILAKYNLV